MHWKLFLIAAAFLSFIVAPLASANCFSDGYSYSRKLNITNQNTTDILYNGWTFNFTIDTTDTTKFLSNCNDLRVYYRNKDIMRNVSDCGTSYTSVWAAIPTDIAPLISDLDYEVCYGRPSATTPPSTDWSIFKNVPITLYNYIRIAAFFNYADLKYLNDSSPYNNNGTEETSGNKQLVDCLFSKCVNFSADSNEDYKIPYHTSFASFGTSDFAMSFWLNYKGAVHNGQEVFLDWRSALNSEHGGAAYINGSLHVGTFFSEGYSGAPSCVADRPIERNTWNHIILLYNKTSCTIYINGNNAGGVVGNNQFNLFADADNHIHVGGRYDASGGDFRGSIDNFLFIGKKLTGNDIDKLYYGSVNPDTKLGIESVPPTLGVFIISPTNSTYYTIHPNLQVTNNMTVSSWWFSLNSGSNVTFRPNTTLNAILGSNVITVYANDTSGNITSDTEYFTVDPSTDTSPPLVVITNPINKTYNISAIALNTAYNKTINATWHQLIYNRRSNFTFYKPINIIFPDGYTETDYQVPINISYESGMAEDFRDVRFFSNCENENAPLQFCLGADCGNDWTNNKSAIILNNSYAEGFLLAPQIPHSGAYCMKYGNSTMKYGGNASFVFSFFDNFDGTTVNYDLWNQTDALSKLMFSVSNGQLSGSGNYNWWRLVSYKNGTLGLLRETMIRTYSVDNNSESFVLGNYNVTADIGIDFIDASLCAPSECTNESINSTIAAVGWIGIPIFLFNTIWKLNTDYSVSQMINNTNSYYQVNDSKRYQELDSPERIEIMHNSLGIYSGTVKWYFVRERKYRYPEPVITYADAGEYAKYSVNVTFTPNSTITAYEGQNHLIVWANDSSVNTGHGEVYFTYDTNYNETIPITPSVAITSPMTIMYGTRLIALNVTSNTTVSAWWYNLNGTGNTYFTPNITINHSSDGQYTIIVYANSTTGDIGSSSVSYYIDSTRPAITVIYPTNGSIINISSIPTSISIYGIASNTHLDDAMINDTAWGMNTGTTSNWNFVNNNVTNTTYSVLITVNDTAGNHRDVELYFTVRYVPPLPPAPPVLPLLSATFFAMLFVAGGLIAMIGMAFDMKMTISTLVGSLIFILIVITLAAQFMAI